MASFPWNSGGIGSKESLDEGSESISSSRTTRSTSCCRDQKEDFRKNKRGYPCPYSSTQPGDKYWVNNQFKGKSHPNKVEQCHLFSQTPEHAINTGIAHVFLDRCSHIRKKKSLKYLYYNNRSYRRKGNWNF